MLDQVEYYRDPAVRRRIAQFVEASSYIVGYGESELWRGNTKGFYASPVSGLGRMLDRGLDILICLQQRRATLGITDIEYYNPRFPGEAHLNPQRVFRLIEPVYECIQTVYRRYGIPVVAVFTGQGYHFWSQFPFGPKHRRLEELGRLEPTVARAYARRRIPSETALGFSGMGRLHLFLAGEILREISTARRTGQRMLPVYFSDVHPPFGREAVSIDLTSYADPVYMRDARVPFSSYQKHRVLTDKVGRKNAAKIPIEILIPRSAPGGPSLSVETCLHLRRHFRHAADLADRTDTRPPDASDGWLNVIEAYQKSRIGAFFHYYDGGPRRPPKFSYRNLPPCIRHALNPWQLLEPTQAQAAVRVLDKMGFHPMEIAELFYRKYRRTPFGHYNPQRRAAFWVESYAALIHAGLDPKRDLTCRDHQNRDRCVKPNCGWNLAKYR
ncbi:MAG: hypothetical protein A3G34_14650 [Candidatus Lindowbacteria bacterium RIFCSPLOWO2_12_FULL_62_27]|nr:MAG: hypothetical protein A3I06_14620 [Candidatus Lindowbacteria bacterium RIFCSPLOWO2_02_FULL_62_12]OGH63098.1 MAG: hypothetical protein A3G34_14650 [Candidatus Lindowbacteria bacterium RIFCSPLOWO2_12_FULL_62_27]